MSFLKNLRHAKRCFQKSGWALFCRLFMRFLGVEFRGLLGRCVFSYENREIRDGPLRSPWTRSPQTLRKYGSERPWSALAFGGPRGVFQNRLKTCTRMQTFEIKGSKIRSCLGSIWSRLLYFTFVFYKLQNKRRKKYAKLIFGGSIWSLFWTNLGPPP